MSAKRRLLFVTRKAKKKVIDASCRSASFREDAYARWYPCVRPSVQSALLILFGILSTSTASVANMLALSDVKQLSITESEFVEVEQTLKANGHPSWSRPDATAANVSRDACVLQLQLIETRSFAGVSALTLSANVASAMRSPLDENVALQSTALQARELLAVLSAGKKSSDVTLASCHRFADIQDVGARLTLAIDAAAHATDNLVQKLSTVHVQERGDERVDRQ